MNTKFSKSQEMAVNWVDGPCLVLAGPGSGKTFVLTNRILNLIKNEGISPYEILIFTFTRAAANEMKMRFSKLLKENNYIIRDLPTFGTFHSIFFEILKENFGYNNDSLIQYEDERKIISNILEKQHKMKLSKDSVNNIITEIKLYKTAIERNEYYIPKYISRNSFVEIYKKYQEILFNQKKLDFHDMISMCYELLSEHKNILRSYQNRYKYILIDEFQDINKSQYDIVKMLCKSKNIFVVGDDDQSIYKFRGSHPKVMKDFLTDYKKAKKIILDENYRCAKTIVDFSKLVIDNNIEHFEKKLKSKRDINGKIEIKAFIDSIKENEHIINLINNYQKKGIELKEMAILYRTNLLGNSIKAALIKNNINYIVKGENINIYDNFAIRDILSYLKLANGDKNSELFMLVANKPLRYISRDAIGYEKCSIDDLIKYYSSKSFVLDNIIKLKNDFIKIKNEITPLAIRYIRKNIGYDKYLKKYCLTKSIDYDEVEELLDAFEEDAIGHNSIKEFIEYIELLKNNNKKNEAKNENSISLMTFHLSKGLEYKVIFIIDANDGLIPHKKSIKEKDIETERRLFYVAMTRAKDFLHIFFTMRRFGKDYRASRFILEAIGGKNGRKR